MSLKTNARHAADDGTIKEAPNPGDVLRERIAEAAFDRQESLDPGRNTVRYAWIKRKEANKLLRKAIRRWFHVLPCRLWWHAAEPVHDPYIGGRVKLCKRCGAWRGEY